MNKPKFSVRRTEAPTNAPNNPQEFAAGAAMVQSQTGGRALKPVRVNVDLDPEVHRSLKLLAMDRHTNIAGLLRELINRELAI